MKRKDLLRKLKEAGFHEVRDDGDHTIYKKEGFLKKYACIETKYGSINNNFIPINEKEFQRVLKSNGYYFRVLPGKYHLLELKEFLYDEVRLNTPKVEELEGFELLKEEIIKDTIELNNKEINDLFTMTPYYYKTSYEAKERLKNLSYLKTKIEFVIRIYKCSKK